MLALCQTFWELGKLISTPYCRNFGMFVDKLVKLSEFVLKICVRATMSPYNPR